MNALTHTTCLSAAALQGELTKSKKREKLLFKRYREAIGAGQKKKAHDVRRVYLGSTAVRFTALAAARAAIKPHERPSLSKCHVIAPSLNPLHPIDEDVRAFAIPKANGKYRAVSKFGVRHRAAQWMVKRLIAPHWHRRPWQYGTGEHGIHSAVRAIKALLQKQPHLYAARLDIQTFYASFDLESLAHKAPLPKKVTVNVVVGRHMKMVHGHIGSHSDPYIDDLPLLNAARRGIPAGSTVSPLIAAWALSSLDWYPPSGVYLFNYADDFLVLGPSKVAVKAAADSLSLACTKVPGGQFLLTLKEEASSKRGFSFLGHWFEVAGGVVDIWPAAGNFNKFTDRREYLHGRAEIRKIYYAQHGTDEAKEQALSAIADYVSYCQSWAAAFSACSEAAIAIADIEPHVSEWLSFCEASLGDLDLASAETWQWEGSGG